MRQFVVSSKSPELVEFAETLINTGVWTHSNLLHRFGLAEVIEVSSREVPISNYCARPTSRGLMLLKLIGQPVPNWNRYFGADGPL